MPDAIGGMGKGIQKAVTDISSKGGKGEGVEGIAKQPAAASEVDKFQNALKGNPAAQQALQQPGYGVSGAGPAGPQSLFNTSGASTIGGPASGGGSGSLGDSILKGMQSLSKERSSTMNEIQRISSDPKGGSMGVIDTLKLQESLATMNLEQEVTSKIAGQVGQGVQTLFRNQ